MRENNIFKPPFRKIRPDSGHFEYGETVVLGYFTQEDISYPTDKRVLEVVKDIANILLLMMAAILRQANC